MTDDVSTGGKIISIHALLAESDVNEDRYGQQYWRISIHALLAESDRFRAIQHPKINISIHALLAESDRVYVSYNMYNNTFLSTLSLRRATLGCGEVV